MRRKLVKATNWKQSFGPVTVALSIKPCAFRPFFRPIPLKSLPRSSIDCTVGATSRAPVSSIKTCRFYQGKHQFLKTSLSPNYYWRDFSRILTPLTSILKTTGLLNKPASGRNYGNGKVVGISGRGDKPPHCWIQLDHPKCWSLERWGLTTMRLLVVVDQMKNCLSPRNLRH